MFQGTTLRGLLLEGYALWEMGQIALIAAICSFVLGGVMLILGGLGLWHLRRVNPAEALRRRGLGRHPHPGARRTLTAPGQQSRRGDLRSGSSGLASPPDPTPGPNHHRHTTREASRSPGSPHAPPFGPQTTLELLTSNQAEDCTPTSCRVVTDHRRHGQRLLTGL